MNIVHGLKDSTDILRILQGLYVRDNRSYSRLARRLGVTPMMVKYILNSERGVGTKVARALGYDVVTLYVPRVDSEGLRHTREVDYS